MQVHLAVDAASATPLYAQVTEQLRALIAAGALQQGDRLPSVRDLAVDLRINRNTIAKAYRVLESDGVLETRSGQGTFVADGGRRWSLRERRRRVCRLLDRAVVEAQHLAIGADEVRSLLDHCLAPLAEPSRKSDS
ncbi:MAG: GntR family transcriptional regulator [Acidobacteriota bacterium]